jgi:hypothetical protein
MEKYIKIAVLILMLVAFSSIALAENITARHEVSQEKQQEKILTSNFKNENRLSSKRIKDKADSINTDSRGTVNERMIKYKQFKDGEGDLKSPEIKN